jgi:hypothetical protein
VHFRVVAGTVQVPAENAWRLLARALDAHFDRLGQWRQSPEAENAFAMMAARGVAFPSGGRKLFLAGAIHDERGSYQIVAY